MILAVSAHAEAEKFADIDQLLIGLHYTANFTVTEMWIDGKEVEVPAEHRG